MAVGCFLIGFAFLIISLASNFITVEKSLSNLSWLALATLIVTLGELYLSPIALSFVTKGIFMGLCFLVAETKLKHIVGKDA